MKEIIKILFIATFVLMSGTAEAAINDLISINFGGNYNNKGAVALSGALDQWDNFTNPVQQVATPLSTATGVSISWNSSGYNDAHGNVNTAFNNGSGNDNKLMNSYIYTTGAATHDIILSGLDKNASYKLYIYSQDLLNASNGQILSVNVNNTLLGQTAPSIISTSTYTAGLNYLTGNFTTDNSGILDITYSSGAGGTGTAVINGIQLLQTSGSQSSPAPVPEPASIVLIGIGGLLAAHRFKKSVPA
jgi:hypothetical protein